DQGDGRPAHDPGDPARRGALRARGARRGHLGRAPRPGHCPALRRLRRGHPRAPRRPLGRPRHRDHGRRARAGVPAADGGGDVITFAKYEIVRTFRNRRFFIFSIGFPVVLYFTIAGPNRNQHDFANSGLPAALYYMVGLTAFGTMNTVLSTGTRIAGERAAGWNRQLRLTPLSTRDYFRTKVVVAYLMA